MKYFSLLGIIGSYLFMFLACSFFDWETFGLFLSYLLETVVLLFLFCVIRIIDQIKHPKRYKNAPWLMQIIVAFIPLVAIQYFFITLISESIHPDQELIFEDVMKGKEVLYSMVSMLIVYIVVALQIKGNRKKIDAFRSNFLIKVAVLSAANAVGFVAVLSFGMKSFIPVLTLMIFIRIFSELYFAKIERQNEKKA